MLLQCSLIFLSLMPYVNSLSATDSAESSSNHTWYDTRSYAPLVSPESWREQFIARHILANYNGITRPMGTDKNNNENGGPVLVYTRLELKKLNSINDAHMEFEVQFRFRQQWVDERLQYADLGFDEISEVNLAYDQIQKLWLPDTFFQNEKRGHYHNVDAMNVFAKVHPNGMITYNRRLSMTFSCIMHLAKYPHDNQTCPIEFGSYAYTTDDIEYIWNPTAAITAEPSATVLPKFIVEDMINTSCSSNTTTGVYSCLRVELQLKRQFSYFLLQLYVPSFLLVGVSCVSYWIDWRAAPGRVPLSIITLLTMITQTHSINSTLPPVSYTKSIDVWIGACVFFIFCSLLEYAFVNFTGVRDRQRKAKAEEREKEQKEQAMRQHVNASNAVVMATAMPVFLPGERHEAQPLLEQLNAYRNQKISSAQQAGLDHAEDEVIVMDNLRSITVQTEPGESDVDEEQYFENQRRNRQSLANRKKLRLSCTLDSPLQLYQLIADRLAQHDKATQIDMIARVVVPIVFFCFNAVYWTRLI